MKTVGYHAIIEMEGIDRKKLDDIRFVKNLVKRLKVEAKFEIVGEKYHKFKPQGLTSVALIASSHFSVHTWPEHGYVAIDLYTCDRKSKFEKGIKIILEEFKPKRFYIEILKRGRFVIERKKFEKLKIKSKI
ncbi:MAG: adenosylmethionine decarboxylase [Candidatus Aenigmarchaeota archaeon ex4484_224]|nr:MAG: adenosylmethionine decarboxylase [Candidatus Aenigmarchaeota archaeon ex4484_224]